MRSRVFFALCLLPLACSDSSATSAPPRNLLVVTMDSVRADRFEAPELFNELPLALAHLQAEAQQFRGISSSPATLPAVASLFTGRHSRELGYPAPDRRLPEEIATLAELFSAKGYDTAAFVSSRALDTKNGIERGFATFSGPDGARTEDYEVTQAAREWLSTESRADKPWFLWVHLNAGHGPYSALETAFNPLNFFYKAMVPAGRSLERKLEKSDSNSGAGALPSYQRIAGPPLFGRYRSFYDARVRVGDWFANELRHSLKYTEQYDRTVFAVIGTHGEALGEHGIEFDHGHNLFDEVLRVPFILRVPGRAAAQSDRLASHVDFAPTLGALFGLELSSPSGTDLFSSGDDVDAPVISELYSPIGAESVVSIRSNDWSLIRTAGLPSSVFDLPNDVTQSNPLSGPEVPATTNLQGQLDQLDSLIIPELRRMELNSTTRGELRALGYILNRFPE